MLFFTHFLHILLILDVKDSENVKFKFSGAIQGVYCTPKVGCFFKMVKIQLFRCFIPQLVKKLYSNGLYLRRYRISCPSFEYKTVSEQYLVA